MTASKFPIPVLVFAALLFAPALPSRAADVPLSYHLSRAGNVSLVIFDSHGHVARELLHAAPRKAGAITEAWDGLDQHGQPVASGSYSWKLLETQGLHSQYLMTLGTNTTPSYALWPGNHNGVVSVAADSTGMYVATGCGEGTPLLIKQTFDGRQLWSVPNWLDAWSGLTFMASDGGVLYGATPGASKIYRFDTATGKVLGVWQAPEFKTATRMAARGGQLVVSDSSAGLIRWIDPATGATIDTAAVPGVVDVAIAADGRILAISSGTVVSLSRDHKTPKVVVGGANLVSPVLLALEENGDILVDENSYGRGYNPLFTAVDPPAAGGKQVKRFSADGRLLAAYGRSGGRLNGLYDPNDFASVSSMAADGQGGFLITEADSPPRRTARFDSSGRLVHEWFGGQMYANFACADPADPSTVWMDSHWGNLTEAKVDYAAKTWKPYAAYAFQGLADGMVGGTFHGGGRWFVRTLGGVTYLARAGSNFQVLRVDQAGRRLVPILACVSNIPHDWGGVKPPGIMPMMEGLRKDPASQNSVIWFDFNGDGKTEPNEFQFYPDQDNLAAHMLADDFTSAAAATEKQHDRQFVRWLLAGAPYYQVVTDKVTLDPLPPSSFGDNRGDTRMYTDSAGSHYTAFNADAMFNFGAGGWGSSSGANYVAKWDSSGKYIWQVGEHAAGSVAKPGEIQYIWDIVGGTHDCVVVSDAQNSYEHVWDKDGLWVGRLLDDPDLAAAPLSAYHLCGENFGGSLYTNPATGNVLFYGGTENATNVYRITGWDQFERQSGDITVSPDQAATFAAKTAANNSGPGVVHIGYARSIDVKGDLSQFKGSAPISIMDGTDERAKVYLAWTPNGLYAAFDVTTDSPWKSAAASPSFVFQSGAAVDISYGPLDSGGAPIPGDVRVVASPLNGGTVTEFEQVLSPDIATQSPATFTTGQGSVTFQRVAAVGQVHETAKLSDPTADDPGGTIGWTVIMQLPIHPPVEFRPGARFLFDASVILASDDGAKSTVRLPWHSRDSADKMTQDTYTEALLRPKNWGIAMLDTPTGF